MKQICYIFIYLNIYTGFLSLVHGQQITLTLSTEISMPENLKYALDIVKEHQDFTSIKKETKRISKALEKYGYLESSLLGIKKLSDSTASATYYLGKKYTQLKIDYSNTPFTQNEIALISKNTKENYFIIPILQSRDVLEKLNQLQTKNGNTFGKLKLTNLTTQDTIVIATLKTSEKSKRIIDSITIKGYEKFPKSFITYFAGIKKGAVFDNKQVIKKNNALNSLGFANSIKPPQALFEKEKTTLYLYLEKQNFNTFDGIIGFATNEQTQNIVFNGYIDLVLNNNLNYGEQFVLKYKADGADQESLTLKTQLPYLFKTPFGIQAELNIFRRDSTFSSTSQSLNVSYQISPSSKAHIGIVGKTSNELLSENQNLENLKDFSSSFLTTGITFIKFQQNTLFPVKTALNLDIGIGNRKTTSKNTKQVTISNVINYSLNFNQKNSIYLQNTTNVMTSDTYLTNELFRFGGINSMRGFLENNIDASMFSVLNTEYRYLVNQQTYLHSIIDVGYFENKILKQKEKLYSIGIGLAMSTKAGLLKFSIANGNIDGQAFKFSNSKIHLSLASQF
ncbi:MAG: Uncharacterised protein [Flavobacteriaceae bacterium]|nr:MAG: Uncharacterised protein [Flavobacteriaceae bacterium]